MPFTFTYHTKNNNKNPLHLFDPELADNHSPHSDCLTRRRAAGMLRFRASPINYGSLSLQLHTRFKKYQKTHATV